MCGKIVTHTKFFRKITGRPAEKSRQVYRKAAGDAANSPEDQRKGLQRLFMTTDERSAPGSDPADFMLEALREAEKALAKDEVPIGAVIEKDGKIIGRGHNLTETSKDPTAHAEIAAIREAAGTMGSWRLLGCRMYVTAEPCSMCAGAMVLARLEKVFIGTMDPKAGACGSLMNLPQDGRLNHRVEIETGIMQPQCREILQSFFHKLRKKKPEDSK